MVKSLWGDECINTKQSTKKILAKIKKPKSVELDESSLSKRTLPIQDRLRIIEENVNRILGVYKENTIVIKTRDQLKSYIDKSISNGIIAIDTETNNSLDPITCKLMGACLYTPNEKNAYVPINHTDLDGNRLNWQLTEQDIFEEFSRLNGIDIVTHNGKFDYKVMFCTTGWEMPVTYDTLIASRLLDENEKAGLKYLYIKYIDPSIEHYSIEHLFENVEYAVVSPEIFALYAATDSYMTYRVFKYQQDKFNSEHLEKLYKLYTEVEMPVMTISAKMELRGISIDEEYVKNLSKKYHSELDKLQNSINKELDRYADVIASWRTTDDANFHEKSAKGFKKSKNEQLKDPVEVTSATQLSILLYDVLKIPPVDKQSPRSTDKDALGKLKDDYRICDLILKQREILKMLTTFIDAIPQKVSEKDGRVHASFNQLGADTGRFSCADPNLQQIPSHRKDIRMMFRASDGYVLLGSDYSQQEPRLLSAYSRDEKLMDSYKNGRDLYATVATAAYHNNYWDNMEHHEDGTDNPEGEKRRSKMKTLVLGIMYGMGSSSMAIKLGCSVDEAQTIINDFYKGFPQVRKWIDDTSREACKRGFVEDFWGRRRRLPDLLLPEYEILKNKSNLNPLVGSSGIDIELQEKSTSYLEKIKSLRSKKDKESIIKQAYSEGIKIRDNTGHIAQAKRQCVNARIQGGAATMSKKAMIAIDGDEELKNMGFHLLIGVHDELIGECPKENAEKASERLTFLMKTCVPEIPVPFKCDPTLEEHWYEGKYSVLIQDQFNKLIKDGKMTKEEAFDSLKRNHLEISEEKLKDYLNL